MYSKHSKCQSNIYCQTELLNNDSTYLIYGYLINYELEIYDRDKATTESASSCWHLPGADVQFCAAESRRRATPHRSWLIDGPDRILHTDLKKQTKIKTMLMAQMLFIKYVQVCIER